MTETRVTADGMPQYWAEQALARLRPPFDPRKSAALDEATEATSATDLRRLSAAE